MTSKLISWRGATAVAKTGLKVAVLAVVLALVAQCSYSAASAAVPTAKDWGMATPQVDKLPLSGDNRPRVEVFTPLRDIKVFVKQVGVESTGGDLADQAAFTTKTYRLNRVAPGTSATWRIVTFDAKTGDRMTRHKFTWNNWKRHFQTAHVGGGRDLYVEVSPSWGGELRVKGGVPRVYVLDATGAGRWERMVLAYGHDGELIFVYTVAKGEHVTAVSTEVLYGAKPKITKRR